MNNGYIRGAYFTEYSLLSQDKSSPYYLPKLYRVGLCTHIFLAFLSISDSFQLVSESSGKSSKEDIENRYRDVIALKNLQKDLKVLVSFGGWGISQLKYEKIKEMLISTRNRKIFIESIIDFIKLHGFDGLDFDFEPSQKHEDETVQLREGISDFLTELKERVESEENKIVLTAAVYGTVSTIYEIETIVKTYDFVNIMCYDYAVDDSGVTKLNSPLHSENDGLSISKSIDAWISAGLPKSKVVVGLPAYGRGWRLSDLAERNIEAKIKDHRPVLQKYEEPGVISFNEIVKLYNLNKRENIFAVERTPSNLGSSPYITLPNGNWITYDDKESYTEKLKWIKKEGLAGAFIWNFNHDNYEAVDEFGETLSLHSLVSKELSTNDSEFVDTINIE
ncbi:chitinase [Pancytospora epiphaga]|nr:chitinase [Pancytospora epiphaga]